MGRPGEGSRGWNLGASSHHNFWCRTLWHLGILNPDLGFKIWRHLCVATERKMKSLSSFNSLSSSFVNCKYLNTICEHLFSCCSSANIRAKPVENPPGNLGKGGFKAFWIYLFLLS